MTAPQPAATDLPTAVDSAPPAGRGRVLVIILNYRTPEMTLRCARAAQHAMAGVDGEILIVENGSQDGSLAELQAALRGCEWQQAQEPAQDRAVQASTAGMTPPPPDPAPYPPASADRAAAPTPVRLWAAERNGGFGAGMNIGMTCGLSDGCAPDFYYLLNSDAFCEEGTIAALRDHLCATPSAGLAGSHVSGEDGTTHITVFRFPSLASEFEDAAKTGIVSRLLRAHVVPMPLPRQATAVDWTAGASLMIRADVIRDIGGFDERFFLYFEETELCHRAARAGWSTQFVPRSRVVHIGSVSTGMKGWQRVPAFWFQSRAYYFARVHGRAYALAATALRCLGGLVNLLNRFVTRKPRSGPQRFYADLLHQQWVQLRQGPLAPSVAQPLAPKRPHAPVAAQPPQLRKDRT